VRHSANGGKQSFRGTFQCHPKKLSAYLGANYLITTKTNFLSLDRHIAMTKLLSTVLLVPTLMAATLLLGQAELARPVWAGTCASRCGPKPLQFTPGQRVSVEVVNQTASLVQFQKVFGTDPVPMRPGQELKFAQGGGTEPNISVYFWDETALPLQAKISQPDPKTLRIEIRPGGRPPGDRSVYLLNDGRVAIF